MALNSPTKVWMWIKVMNFGFWVKWKVEITVDLRLLSSIISQDRALSGFVTCTFTVICRQYSDFQRTKNISYRNIMDTVVSHQIKFR